MTDLDKVLDEYNHYRQMGLSLDMTRGKPSSQQLDLSMPLMSILSTSDYRTLDGTDCRNYGGVDGIPEARQLFAEFFGCNAEQVIVGGNASLQLMHDTLLRCMFLGVSGQSPWGRGIQFLCPSPGYDRHFAICELLGISMIPVPLDSSGPDMDMIEELVLGDSSIKGIWCVPKYSNPTGCIYSDEVIYRLANMQTAAEDFRIFWDNAYGHHHFTGEDVELGNILEACIDAGNDDRVFMFGSTSKITFASAGIAAMAGSKTNVDSLKKLMLVQSIGPDKLNQLRHVKFFGDMEGIKAHLGKHAEILRPKFEKVDEVLETRLGGSGMASWTKPKGGYFVSLDTTSGVAGRVVELARMAGVQLTAAGATWPYGNDPYDTNIRIAPSMPTVEEIDLAINVLCCCIELATLEMDL